MVGQEVDQHMLAHPTFLMFNIKWRSSRKCISIVFNAGTNQQEFLFGIPILNWFLPHRHAL